ncbi:MAG: hypothetical protein R3D78_15375, partial [Paracoccaceae bacterium]
MPIWFRNIPSFQNGGMYMDDQIAKVAVQAKPEAPQGEVSAKAAKVAKTASTGAAVKVEKPADPADPHPAVVPGEEKSSGVRSFPRVDPNAVRLAFETGKYPYPHRLARAAYEKEKA